MPSYFEACLASEDLEMRLGVGQGGGIAEKKSPSASASRISCIPPVRVYIHLEDDQQFD